MIRPYTKLNVADNTGIKKIQVIRVLRGSSIRYGTIGDVVVANVREVLPSSQFKKGDVVKAVIVRLAKEIKRPDGTYVRFDDNAAVVIDQMGEPKGTRVFGPVARELREKGYLKIISLAPEVL
ncbi:50S ribosomal protein L14 [Coprothermobacteraceae bacterium]|nr:50S ribosomal protein L14 [Coprothermobacteraceae bacterium]